MEPDHVEPVEQVLSERSRAHVALHVPRRRGQDPHVDLPHPRLADPADLRLLQHAQELHLEGQRQLAHLVEQHRAPVRLLEEPGLVRGRPGERPAHVPEELRLEQLLGDRAAVDRHERAVAPGAHAVDRAGHDLLAPSRSLR